ncbi:hypothetical protein RJ55_06826 [Drechmeria coniospora]|nr:hypothetical protein RJ55_06826 [Drechmeria coniospora]
MQIRTGQGNKTPQRLCPVAASDSLKLSNLDDDLLAELRGKLAGVPIRHLMLIKLESTRNDVSPVKKDGIAWERLANTFKDKKLPPDTVDRIATLTPNARFLTGDSRDGLEDQRATSGDPDSKPARKGARGGLNANNTYTTSNYTLKSLAGTHCGISPLAADFNVEHNFTSYKWKSAFMQSTTTRYDKQGRLMPQIGFQPDTVIDVNYYGMPEMAIQDYLRDAFASAQKNNERVFVSHLTSTTHHAFGMPAEEKYIPLSGDKEWDILSHYLNTIGYVDRWLGKVLDMLESEGVADETLLILVGDHGLSIAERGSFTPNGNPHVGNYHVPLVLSHPKLPAIDTNDAVLSLQILPTILDLLVETGSLSEPDAAVARDLARNYEGQSLLRPLRKFSETTGHGTGR